MPCATLGTKPTKTRTQSFQYRREFDAIKDLKEHWGPNLTKEHHKGSYRTIRDHTGAFGAILDQMAPYRNNWDYKGPNRTIRDHKGSCGNICDHNGNDLTIINKDKKHLGM